MPLRVSWWKWLLFTVGTGILISAFILGAWVALWWYWSVDLMDYLELASPPALTHGTASFLLLFAILGTTVVPVALLALMDRTRSALLARITWPRRGAYPRLFLGALLFWLLQWAWGRWGVQPPESLRVVDHIIEAVRMGGAFWPTFWLFLFIGGVGPVVEELFFRGMLLGSLRQRYPFWIAALITGVSFGLGHGLINGMPTALMGLFFCWQVEQDDSLLPAMLLHAGNNTLAVILALLIR
jgi:membrane protease YdiL (CAAX protease family)